MTPSLDSLCSAVSLANSVAHFAGWVPAGQQLAFALSGDSSLRTSAERLLLIFDPSGEGRRSARAAWSALDEIRRGGAL